MRPPSRPLHSNPGSPPLRLRARRSARCRRRIPMRRRSQARFFLQDAWHAPHWRRAGGRQLDTDPTMSQAPAGTLGGKMKFAVGQPLRRFEDLRLITGKGRYTDDIVLPGMVHGYVLRSPVAHARVVRVDATAARGMPGVLLILTGEDVEADGLGDVPCVAPLTNRDGTPRHDTPRPVLAIGKVRHTGQPVAFV